MALSNPRRGDREDEVCELEIVELHCRRSCYDFHEDTGNRRSKYLSVSIALASKSSLRKFRINGAKCRGANACLDIIVQTDSLKVNCGYRFAEYLYTKLFSGIMSR